MVRENLSVKPVYKLLYEYEIVTYEGVEGIRLIKYEGAFRTDLKIPTYHDGLPVIVIGGETFIHITERFSVDISKTVLRIESLAFLDNIIGYFRVDEENQNYKSVSGVLFTKDGKILLRYCTGNTSINYQIPDDVVSIYPRAFNNSQHLVDVYYGKNLRYIGINAFTRSKELKKFVPVYAQRDNQLTEISPTAFYRCEKLSEVVLVEGLKTIGNLAFGMCDALISITIPSTVQSMGTNVFNTTSALSITVKMASKPETWADVWYVGDNITVAWDES